MISGLGFNLRHNGLTLPALHSNKDRASRVASINATDLENYRAAISGMIEMCEDVVDTTSDTNFCSGVSSLSGNLDNFEASGDVGAYNTLLNDLLGVTIGYSPWSAILVDKQETQQSLQEAGPVTRIRGGVESLSTARFDIDPTAQVEFWYERAQNITQQSGGNPFNEYIFLSNGVSASAGALLPYTLSQLWKNADSTRASRKVALLGYGGTGKADDMTFGSVPASVQGVNLEFPLIGSAALQM